MEEHVVLVDEDNKILGNMPKKTVHSLDTPLHREKMIREIGCRDMD